MDVMNTPCDSLLLADGTSWSIHSGDEPGAELVKSLADSMRLSPCSSSNSWHLIIKNDIRPGASRPDLPLVLAETTSQTLICSILPVKNNIDLADQLMEVGLVISSCTEAQGGILIHGALAEKNGQGIILAGPSDAGKTTASQRLPSSWTSLSDDCTLVVCDDKGQYHAHPWPTWSSFLFNGNQGQSWDVQSSVPLKGIFMLVQDKVDAVKALGSGESACMLYENAEHAWFGLDTDFDQTKKQQLRTRRFNNICELTKAVPSYLLHCSLKGAFWEKIEQELF